MANVPPVVYCFHRDLRIVDNKGLLEAVRIAKSIGSGILPIFIFTPAQVSSGAPVRSLMSIACMFQCLRELDSELRSIGSELYCFYGKEEDVLLHLYKALPFYAYVEACDYTPYAKARSVRVKEVCDQMHVLYNSVHDLYLHAPGTILNKSGRTFQKFTPFYNAALGLRVDGVERSLRRDDGLLGGLYGKLGKDGITLDIMENRIFEKDNGSFEQRAYKGGRSEGLRLLRDIPRNYAEIHDILAEQTSGLSVHHHFGSVSIRESYARGRELGLDAFVRQLYWRDFYGHIMNDFEHLYESGVHEFKAHGPHGYDSAAKKKIFKAWCTGTTGVPLVDAGMRQLLATGFMHNRVRLVVASWLIKDMGVWWKWGELFFAEKLLDYDLTQNMMNWIWVASLLPFSQAPFRRHDPNSIAKRLDPDGVYVKRWLS
jgi:deoxyribodipyrimidine photo-lyase